MIAMLELEVFANVSGSLYRAPLQGNAPWVAEITGLTRQGKFARTFIHGDVDYTHANSVGSRGIHKYYHLQSGRIYEVAARPSWKRTVQYFCRVHSETGEIIYMTRQEVLAALQGSQHAQVQALSRGVSDE